MVGVSVHIRRPHLCDAPRLTELALRSKAMWGYDPSFMAACRRELTVTPAYLASARCWACYEGDTILGFCAFQIRRPASELDFMFVEPAATRRGVGRALLHRALADARGHGVARLRVASDPDAAPFYRRMGARYVGRTPSESVGGRTLPTFELATATSWRHDADGGVPGAAASKDERP